MNMFKNYQEEFQLIHQPAYRYYVNDDRVSFSEYERNFEENIMRKSVLIIKNENNDVIYSNYKSIYKGTPWFNIKLVVNWN